MSDKTKPKTAEECTQLLQDFIDARIWLFMCRHENKSDSTWQNASDRSDALFKQITDMAGE